VGRACTEGRIGVFMGWAPQCVGDPEICVHRCVLVIRISMHGCTRRGEKGVHSMHAYLRHSCAWVCIYVVDKHAVMRSYVRDRGAWRRLCMADRHALIRAYGMNRRTCVRACGVNRHANVRTYGVIRCAYVCACGLKKHACVRAYGFK
jgi:hypothetical protein